MIIINSSGQFLVGRIGEVVQKMIEKKVLLNNPQEIENLKKDLQDCSEDSLESLIKVLNKFD